MADFDKLNLQGYDMLEIKSMLIIFSAFFKKIV